MHCTAFAAMILAAITMMACRRTVQLDPPTQVVAKFVAAMASRDTSAIRQLTASDSLAAALVAGGEFGSGRWATVPATAFVSPKVTIDRSDTLGIRYETRQRQRCGSAPGPDDYIDAILVRRAGEYRVVLVQLGPVIC